MREWLVRQKTFRDAHFPECEHVFSWHPVDCEIDPIFKAGHGGLRSEPGTPLKNFYNSWKGAAKVAGFPGLLFHDLRRSAIRNMVTKMGISEKRAMEIGGHLTRSMFDRYDIVALGDIRKAVGRVTSGSERNAQKSRKS